MSAADIFGDAGGAYTYYRAGLQVRDQIVGGVPKDPETIKKHLTAKLEMGDRELLELQEVIADELGDQLQRRPSTGEIVDKVAAEYAAGNGFKKIDGTLVYEGRCLKAGLKEAANVAYPGTDFPGKPKGIRKGLMRYMAERVFVTEQYIPLGVSEPSDTENRIKHVMTPLGPKSAINVVDIVHKPLVEATIKVLDDCLPQTVWQRIWEALEEIGIGADRARSDGRFDLVQWERVS